MRFLILFHGWRAHKIPLPRINCYIRTCSFTFFISPDLAIAWVLVSIARNHKNMFSSWSNSVSCYKLFNNSHSNIFFSLFIRFLCLCSLLCAHLCFVGIFLLYHTCLNSHLRVKNLCLFRIPYNFPKSSSLFFS